MEEPKITSTPIMPGDYPVQDGRLHPADLERIPKGLSAEAKDGVTRWAKVLVEGGYKGPFDRTPVQAIIVWAVRDAWATGPLTRLRRL